MKLVILDYLRRKWWVLGPVALLELVIGGCAAFFDSRSFSGVEGMQLQVGIFTGAFLLSMDLQRGAARTVAMLPLTAKDIGRAWWLATVGVPAAVFSALLFLGAGLVCLGHASARFPLDMLATTCLYLLAMLGSTYPMMLGMNPLNRGTAWRGWFNGILGGLWGLMIGGSLWIMKDLDQHPVRFYGFIVIGLGLTFFGWFATEKLVLGRATFRLNVQTGGGTAAQLPGGGIPSGYGGVALLVSSSFMRALRMGVAMTVVMMVMFSIMGGGNWRRIVESLGSMGLFPFWFMIFFALMPNIMQLRLLRSLPMSASMLAASLMLCMALPLVIFGGLAAGVAGAVSGTPAAFNILNVCLLTVPPAALSLAFFTWRGHGMLSYLVMILTLMTAQFLPLLLQMTVHSQPIAAWLTAGLAMAGVLISFWLIRLALTRGSQTYRVNSQLMTHAQWGWGG